MTKIERFTINQEIFKDEDFMKDCPENNVIPTIIPPVPRIIAIGDIHGDYQLAVRSMQIAGLIQVYDDDIEWIADPPETVVIQVGDQIDSCRNINGVYNCRTVKQSNDIAEDIKVMEFFNLVDRKARMKGGAVLSLLGNHELMNVDGIFNYVSYENYYNFSYTDKTGTYTNRREAFKPGGPTAKMMACTRNAVIIVGNNLFVHAGILPGLVKKIEYTSNIDNKTKLVYINKIIRKWLLNRVLNTTDAKNAKKILDVDGDSIFWTREFGNTPVGMNINDKLCANVLASTDFFKIGQIIVGHTPQLFANNDGINGTCIRSNGIPAIFRVDGGFSRSFKIFPGSKNNNLVQVLEIVNDSVFNVISDIGSTSLTQQPQVGIIDSLMKKIASIYSQDRVNNE